MANYLIRLSENKWHPIAARPAELDAGDFHPRPEEVLTAVIGPAYPTEPLEKLDEEVRDLLNKAHIEWDDTVVVLRSDLGEAEFRVQVFTTEDRDRPQQLTWIARLLQARPWVAYSHH
jgi:hypothetical protein